MNQIRSNANKCLLFAIVLLGTPLLLNSFVPEEFENWFKPLFIFGSLLGTFLAGIGIRLMWVAPNNSNPK